MLPYLAIIKDSFRAASQSMMLRTLFVVVTMLLLFILPFGYTETLTGHVRWQEIPNWREKMDEIYAAKEVPEPSPEKHIWSMLSDPLQKEANAIYDKLHEELETIAKAAEAGEEPPQWDRAEVAQFNQRINNMCMLLHKELDENLLEDPDFYDKAAWRQLVVLRRLPAGGRENAGKLLVRRAGKDFHLRSIRQHQITSLNRTPRRQAIQNFSWTGPLAGNAQRDFDGRLRFSHGRCAWCEGLVGSVG